MFEGVIYPILLSEEISGSSRLEDHGGGIELGRVWLGRRGYTL